MSEESKRNKIPDKTPPSRPGRSDFLWRTKKFWLPPIILAALLLALLYFLAGESEVVAPFIYGI